VLNDSVENAGEFKIETFEDDGGILYKVNEGVIDNQITPIAGLIFLMEVVPDNLQAYKSNVKYTFKITLKNDLPQNGLISL
jgi:hypothetical protein